MVVLRTCKYEEDRIKNQGARVLPNKVIRRFFRLSKTINSAVSGVIPPKFEHIKAFMVVLDTYKNEADRIKNQGARVLTTFLPL